MVGFPEMPDTTVPPGKQPLRGRRRRWYHSLLRKLSAVLGLFCYPWLEEMLVGYEKGGLAVFGEPIPWNASTILVEALVWGRGLDETRKEDFSLRLPRSRVLLPATATPREEGRTLISFRLPPIQQETWAEFCWRSYSLRRIELLYLSAQEFLQGLQLRSPTLLARYGDHHIACHAGAPGACDGLLTSAFLTSPTSLLPILDLDLRLEVANHALGLAQTILLESTASQLTAPQALVCRALRPPPEGSTPLSVRWMVADRTLGQAEFVPVSQGAFEESLYVVDAGYLYRRPDHSLILSRYLPHATPGSLLGGCFYLASRQCGFAGYCPVEVCCRAFDSDSSSIVLAQQVLVLDRPSPLLIPPAVIEELPQCVLELFSRGRKLATLPVFPCPQATFTSEGGIQEQPNFQWTEAAEWELANRLEQLLAASADPSGTKRDGGGLMPEGT